MTQRIKASTASDDPAAPVRTPSRIRAGTGGWTYAPWRSNFYPAGLVQRRELEYASRHVTAIEINGTFYGAQKPASYAAWRAQTPDGFVFSLKAPRYATERKALAGAGSTIKAFVFGGLAELGDRLGPINWQLPKAKRFERDDLAAFFDLLPRELDGMPLVVYAGCRQRRVGDRYGVPAVDGHDGSRVGRGQSRGGGGGQQMQQMGRRKRMQHHGRCGGGRRLRQVRMRVWMQMCVRAMRRCMRVSMCLCVRMRSHLRQRLLLVAEQLLHRELRRDSHQCDALGREAVDERSARNWAGGATNQCQSSSEWVCDGMG